MRVIAPDPSAVTVPLPTSRAASEPLPGTFIRSHRAVTVRDPRAAIAIALIVAGCLLGLGALLALCALGVLVRLT